MSDQQSLAITAGRAVVAGLAGTAVMTAFQKLVEMPLTGRDDSYAPADFATKVLPVNPGSPRQRTQLNYVTHFALGAMWGGANAVAARSGLRGQRAVLTVFGTVYSADVALNTALGLYRPWTWSAQDWVIDVGEKFIQAAATGAVFDHIMQPSTTT